MDRQLDDVHDTSIDDTGERMVPAHHRGHMVYGEHLVRYSSAQQLVKGKTVLDIASGSGYGSAMLGHVAKHVYGVDIDASALAYAQANYASDVVEFQAGSATAIPLADASVDVVVSFETIEHIDDYKKFMSEIKRVLRSDGLLVLSTPNDTEFPESNHFHLHEFERAELGALIKESFQNAEWYYQGTWLYTALLTEDELTRRQASLPLSTIGEAPITPEQAIYFFVLCSNREITEQLTSIGVVAEHWSARRVEENDTAVRNHINEQGKVMEHLANELRLANEKAAQLLADYTTLKRRFGRINSVISKVRRPRS